MEHILKYDEFLQENLSINEAVEPMTTADDIVAVGKTVKAPKGVDFQIYEMVKGKMLYTKTWDGKVYVQAWVENPKFEMKHTYHIYIDVEEGRFVPNLDSVVANPLLGGGDAKFGTDAKKFKASLKEWLKACIRVAKSKEKEVKQRQSKWHY